MFGLPSLPPSWDGWHPLIVHFPIALLLSSPVLILLALGIRKHEHPLKLAAWLIMIMGTVGAFLAVSSGEAAGELVPDSPVIGALLEEHEEAAEASRTVFAVMTLIFGVYTLAPWLSKKTPSRTVMAAMGVVFLALYTIPCLMLANAAHLGGMLVHTHGVRAQLVASPEIAPSAPRDPAAEAARESNGKREHADDDDR